MYGMNSADIPDRFESHIKANTMILLALSSFYILAQPGNFFDGLAVVLLLSPLLTFCLIVPAVIVSVATIIIELLMRWLHPKLFSAATLPRATIKNHQSQVHQSLKAET